MAVEADEVEKTDDVEVIIELLSDVELFDEAVLDRCRDKPGYGDRSVLADCLMGDFSFKFNESDLNVFNKDDSGCDT